MGIIDTWYRYVRVGGTNVGQFSVDMHTDSAVCTRILVSFSHFSCTFFYFDAFCFNGKKIRYGTAKNKIKTQIFCLFSLCCFVLSALVMSHTVLNAAKVNAEYCTKLWHIHNTHKKIKCEFFFSNS